MRPRISLLTSEVINFVIIAQLKSEKKVFLNNVNKVVYLKTRGTKHIKFHEIRQAKTIY